MAKTAANCTASAGCTTSGQFQAPTLQIRQRDARACGDDAAGGSNNKLVSTSSATLSAIEAVALPVVIDGRNRRNDDDVNKRENGRLPTSLSGKSDHFYKRMNQINLANQSSKKMKDSAAAIVKTTTTAHKMSSNMPEDLSLQLKNLHNDHYQVINQPDSHQAYLAGSQDRPVDQTTSSLGRKFAITCAIVFALYSICCPVEASSSSSPQTASTTAYGDPIKWSFGGWAPLDGAKNGTKGAKGAADSSRQQQLMGTSPLPPISPTARPNEHNLHNNHTLRASAGGSEQKRTQSSNDDSMKEAASNSHDKQLQYGSHYQENPLRAGAGSQLGYHPSQMGQHAAQMPPHKLQTGPAYALPLQRSPPEIQFSQPAPVPIVRDQVVPMANQKQVSFLPGPPPPAHQSIMQHPTHYPQAQQQPKLHQQQQPHPAPAPEQHHQHRQSHIMMPHGPHPMGPTMSRPPGFYEHQRLLQEHHQRQHRMFQQMFQHHQTPRGMSYPQPARSHGQQQPAVAYRPLDEPNRNSAPRYMGPPAMMHPEAHQHQQHQHQQQQYQEPAQQQQQQQQHYQQQQYQHPNAAASMGGQFKPSEGDERPIAYTNSLPDERIPLLEINGANGNRNNGTKEAMQLQHQLEPSQTSTTVGAGSDQLYGSSLAANEKANLNYQNALSQVAADIADDQANHYQHQQSNNIQDIKQRQQYEQKQLQKAGVIPSSASGPANGGLDKKPIVSPAHNSPPSYLTIPVAVETEGDKVLTPDDINEIEKHVIKVLPNLKTADKIAKMADAHLGGLAEHVKATTATIEQVSDGQVVVGGPEMHQMNYDEHQMTLKQLEGDMGPSTASSKEPKHHGSTSPATEQQPPSTMSYQTSSSSGPTVGQVTIVDGEQQQRSAQPNQPSPSYHNQDGRSTQGQPGSSTGTVTGTGTGGHPMNNQQQHPEEEEQQYFVATGPMHEVGSIGDDDQLMNNDYNLIKNDLMHFRYEPTRAQPGGRGTFGRSRGPQTASTPPMPYTASNGHHSSSRRPQQVIEQPMYTRQQAQEAPEQHHSTPAISSEGPSSGSSRLYMPASSSMQPPTPRPLRLFGRPSHGRGNSGGGYGGRGSSATTKTILGGRRVSDVMRALIHTTPVPMTSPLHVPSVEPEKVDAIQFIAGKANDKQPMVVEPHQLVNHTPDGGFDFNSGAPLAQQAAGQPQPSNSQPMHANQDNVDEGKQQQQQDQQQPPRQQRQYLSSTSTTAKDQSGGNNDGAVIEYVAMNEPTTQGNVQIQHQEQSYEIHGQPEAPVYMNVEQERENNGAGDDNNRPVQQQPIYDYTMTTQPLQQATSGQSELDAPQQQQYGGQSQPAPAPQGQPSLAWSPSVAHHNQQQQLELTEHAGPSQPMDMPATAGYNFFSQQQEQPPPTSVRDHEYDQQQQQHQYEHEDGQAKGWRSKAGGSMPNPDAQYDGQIVKGEQEQQQQVEQEQQQAQNNPNNQDQIEPGNHQPQQQQYPANYANQQQQTIELSRLTQSQDSSRPQEDREQYGQQQQQQQQQHDENESSDAYQQQQPEQQYQEQVSSNQPTGNNGDSGQQQQQQGDGGYHMSTSSYVGGAQFNQQQPADSNYNVDHQQQQVDGNKYDYMKLDGDRQRAHLAQHQAQHQAQLAEMLNNPSGGGSYQTTTTPISSPTSSPSSSSDQQDTTQQQIEQEVTMDDKLPATTGGGNGNNGGYMVEQVESRPSVQSPPDSMLINDSPPMQMSPITDQQSLISDAGQNSEDHFSDDDRAKQQNKPATAVYQVYQAYYAPKDHKPLPGYVRLSLEEFNELFRDAEIQYVDKNMNRLQNLVNNNANNGDQHSQTQQASANGEYEQQHQQQLQQLDANNNSEMMKASASEQSIVVDRRSISGPNNSTAKLPSGSQSSSKKPKSGPGVKKIISIRNSRPVAKQQPAKTAKLTSTPKPKTSNSTTKKMTTPKAGGPTTTTKKPTTDQAKQQKQKQQQQPKKKPEEGNKQRSQPTTTTSNTKPAKLQTNPTTVALSSGDKKANKP